MPRAMASTRCLKAAAVLSMFLSPVVVAFEDCYTRVLGTIVNQKDGWISCTGTNTTDGGAQSCCQRGSECGPDGICYTPVSIDIPNGSWYIAGCTDGTYKDSVCRVDCTNYLTTFIQWNTSTNVWGCCGGDGCDANTIFNQTFSAISPPNFQAAASSPLQTSSVASSSATSSASSSSTSSLSGSTTSSVSTSSTTQSSLTTQTTTSGSVSAQSSSSNLSGGAKAGIGIGVAIGALTVIGAGAFFFLRRHKHASTIAFTSDAKTHYQPPPGYEPVQNHPAMSEMGDAAPKAELHTPVSGGELQGDIPTRHELPAKISEWAGQGERMV
ncbi:Hypothetical protein R9X50_00058300 [Acrodontium crateriforme]|uniref:Uncharacterized protein n=1 Tax=Acrodontium crateriforme TaxID=150365 RepID=A0AAQ3M0J2_9PEZI|nr:Hypothetical protein R9X50_00058300 [Acrodontium crateriforme]